MSRLGMDVEAITNLAARLDSQASALNHTAAVIDGLVRRAVSEWHGNSAIHFANDWNSRFRPALMRAHDSIAGLADSARHNAADQLRTSSGDGALPAGVTASPSAMARLQALWTTADHGVSASQSFSSMHTAGIGAHGSTTIGGVPLTGHAELSASAGAQETANASMSMHGADAAFAASIAAGVAASASGRVGSDDMNLSGQAHASAGVEAGASGKAHIGMDGASAHVGGHALAGASVDGSATGHITGVDGTVGGHAYAGIGIEANADASISLHDVKASIDFGAALGVGAGVDVSIDVHPDEILSHLPHLF